MGPNLVLEKNILDLFSMVRMISVRYHGTGRRHGRGRLSVVNTFGMSYTYDGEFYDGLRDGNGYDIMPDIHHVQRDSQRQCWYIYWII